MYLSTLLSIWFPDNWSDLLTPSVPIFELVVRGSIVYLALFFGLRFILKREAAALEISDLLVIVLIADAVSNGMSGSYTSVTDALVLAATLVGWNWFLAYLAFRFPAMRWVIRPEPLLLISEGQLLERNVRREYLTHQEIMGQLREQGVERIEDVEKAYMESSGVITVIPRKQPGESKKRRRSPA
jgi:uncharacterized membrane protein YcaP (DUF421 family)